MTFRTPAGLWVYGMAKNGAVGPPAVIAAEGNAAQTPCLGGGGIACGTAGAGGSHVEGAESIISDARSAGSYLELFKTGELARRAEALDARLARCDLCPRVCG